MAKRERENLEAGMEFVSMAVDKFFQYTGAPIARQVGYVISYKSNVEELQKEAEKLQHVRDSVQHRVDAALRNGEEVEAGILEWLEVVHEIAVKAEELDKDEEHAKCKNLRIISLLLLLTTRLYIYRN